MVDRKSRSVGALLGVHCGDSLGASLEFASFSEAKRSFPNGIHDIQGGGPFKWPAGHATDDTDLTRAVLLAYITRSKGESNDIIKTSADNMLDWFDKGPVDVGGATSTALSKYRASRNPSSCGAGMDMAGNGSLMRCIPTALFVSDLATLIDDSMKISAITHNDTRCTVACAAYNIIASSLLKGTPARESVMVGLETLSDEHSNYFRTSTSAARLQVRRAIEIGLELQPADLTKDGLPRNFFPGRARGYVLESLTLGIAALVDPRPFPQVLSDIVCLGGDADTNGAIAGGLLGARDGLEAIPARWIDKLQFGEEFLGCAIYLPRPENFTG